MTPLQMHQIIDELHVLANDNAMRVAIRHAHWTSICCYTTIWFWMSRPCEFPGPIF